MTLEIQTDVSDAALVTAIRTNLCNFFRMVSQSDPAENVVNAQFTRWHTPIPHSWFNGMLASAPPDAQTEDLIADTLRYFRQREAAAITWWLDPHLRSADWEAVLTRHGFVFADDTPGMAVDLQQLNEDLPANPGFEIRAVTDEAALRTWANIFITGYGLPADWEPWSLALWQTFGLDFPVRNYLGYLHGEPVATATVFYSGGVAGIYDVATLPVARGKGIGTALTLHALQEARARGYRIGVLQSSEMGFHIYQKLGFKHLCQIEHFYLAL